MSVSLPGPEPSRAGHASYDEQQIKLKVRACGPRDSRVRTTTAAGAGERSTQRVPYKAASSSVSAVLRSAYYACRLYYGRPSRHMRKCAAPAARQWRATVQRFQPSSGYQ